MPTYSYECSKGHEFEVQQKIKEAPLKKCTIKGCKAKVKRLINFNGAIIKKGSGWTPKFH
jgi:putative FmdB family regulatory protein